jgi:protein TonB
MKSIFITVFISLFYGFSIFAQNEEEDQILIHIIENPPIFEDGMDNFYKIASKNLRSVDDKIGRVFVQFLIDTTGKMSEVKVVKGLSEKSDAEVLRLMKWINSTYSWKPRLVRGQKVITRQSLPIVFGEENRKYSTDSLPNLEIDLSFIDSIKIPPVKIEKEEEKEEMIFCWNTEIPASFEGGMENFYKIIRENLEFPKEAKTGRVFFQFVIDTTGKMIDIEFIKSPNEQNNKAVLKLIDYINENYSWKPATSRGKKVKVRMNMPIIFKLEKNQKSNTERVYRR